MIQRFNKKIGDDHHRLGSNNFYESIMPKDTLLSPTGVQMKSANQYPHLQSPKPFQDLNMSLGIVKKQTHTEDEDLYILKGYKYATSYLPSKGPRRRKRVLHCKYSGCSKQFIKAWNFLDHARMHLGEKPFSCDL